MARLVLLANRVVDLQLNVPKLNKIIKEYNLEIFCSKTKLSSVEGKSTKSANIMTNLINPIDSEDQHRIHKNSPIISIMRQINPILLSTPISLRSILILSSHLFLSLLRDLFPVGLHVKILKALLALFHFGYMTCPS